MGDAFVKHIVWDVEDESIIGYRYPDKDIPTNSILKVEQGQVAVFIQYTSEGSAMKVFPEGLYQLETQLPVGNEKGFFRKLFSKATGTNIYQCDIYFFRTTLKGLKWRTENGPVQCGEVLYKYETSDISAERRIKIFLRGYGTYEVSVIFDEFDDPDTIKTIIKKIMGQSQTFTTNDVQKKVGDLILENMSTVFGNVVRDVGADILNVAKYYSNLSRAMEEHMTPILRGYGFALNYFTIASLDMPDSVMQEWEKLQEEGRARQAKRDTAIDDDFVERLRIEREAKERLSGGYMQEKQIEVMRAAASNEGMAGTFMGAGMGLGMGVGMGGVFGAGMNNMAQGAMGNVSQMGGAQQPSQQETCPSCGAVKQPNSNFCNACGHAFGIKCPSCGAILPTGSKFCNSCGQSLIAKCTNCGADLAPGSKFCNSCGAKV